MSEKNAKLYWIDQQPDLNTSFVQISDTEDIEIKASGREYILLSYTETLP